VSILVVNVSSRVLGKRKPSTNQQSGCKSSLVPAAPGTEARWL
jgi:hypothetical protein